MRTVKNGKRELVIGRATRGYVALYRDVAAIDTVFALAVRAQREGGFKRENGLHVKAQPSHAAAP